MLDEFQTKFCESTAGNIRLLAPAGSGKTHSLLWRCKRVHERKGGSARFLVVTFTRAARDELRKRLASPDFIDIRSSVEVATLNSWGFRRVRQNHHSPRLQVSEADRSFCVQNALQPVWKRHDLIAKVMAGNAFRAGKVLMNLMDLMKSLGFVHREPSPDAVMERVKAINGLGLFPILDTTLRDLRGLGLPGDLDFNDLFPGLVPFWIEACEHLIGQSLFTLEDQKYVAYLDLAEQRAEGRVPVGGARITHVLVDEFQDINPLDLALLKEIVDLNGSELTIVGDDDQAIFEWRGATFRYIVQPETHIGRAFETFILEKNYRSAVNIVEHSQRLIRNNQNRVAKNVFPVLKHRATIELKAWPNFDETIDSVMEIARTFRGEIAAGARPAGARLALVSRKRAQLIPYQILLAAEDIPFCAAEDLQIFLSKAFENLTTALTVCSEFSGRPRPRQVLDDVLHMCNLVKRYPLSRKDRTSLDNALRAHRLSDYQQALSALRDYRGPLKGTNDDGQMSAAYANAIADILRADTVSAAIDALGSRFAGLDKDYGKSHEDIFYSDPPFFYLSQFARRYGDDFERFIDDIDQASRQLAQLPVDEDEEVRQSAAGQGDVWARPIHLMTALRAKGKEFDTVVMLDVNDGIWPTVYAETPEQKEQERRLFYVAMTRARNRLVMTLSGRIGDKVTGRSPFLAEAGL